MKFYSTDFMNVKIVARQQGAILGKQASMGKEMISTEIELVSWDLLTGGCLEFSKYRAQVPLFGNNLEVYTHSAKQANSNHGMLYILHNLFLKKANIKKWLFKK